MSFEIFHGHNWVGEDLLESINTGLLHYWKFEGNANDSKGTAHGTLVNSPTLVNGLLGQAYSFNGINQYISVPDAVSATPTITVAWWAKSNTVQWDNYGIIASARSANGFLAHGTINDKGQSYYVYNSSGTNGPEANPNTPTDIQIWHLYGFMYDSVNSVMYPFIDGVISGTEAMAVPRVSDTVPLSFVFDPATNNYGNLILDNFAIWNRLLTTDELTYYYNSGLGRSLI